MLAVVIPSLWGVIYGSPPPLSLWHALSHGSSLASPTVSSQVPGRSAVQETSAPCTALLPPQARERPLLSLPGFQRTQQLSSAAAHAHRAAHQSLSRKDSQGPPSCCRTEDPPPLCTMSPQALVPPVNDTLVPYIPILPLSADAVSVLVKCIPQ